MKYHPGSLVRIIRQPEGRVIGTLTGIYGFVLFTAPEEGRVYVCGYAERDREHSSCGMVAFADLAPCRDTGWAEFLTPLAAEKLARKSDPVVDKIMAEMGSPDYRDKEAKDAAARETWAKENPNPFIPDRSIKRNDKGNYFAYHSDAAQKAENIRRGVACGTSRAPGDMVTLERTNDFLDQASFWPDREIVRNLVRELDLDPYAGRFNRALYRPAPRQRAVPTSELRQAVIRLLNAGYVILDLTPVNEEDCCRDDGEFWIIAAGKRKQLPVA
jgi:hypothetical protein